MKLYLLFINCDGVSIPVMRPPDSRVPFQTPMVIACNPEELVDKLREYAKFSDTKEDALSVRRIELVSLIQSPIFRK